MRPSSPVAASWPARKICQHGTTDRLFATSSGSLQVISGSFWDMDTIDSIYSPGKRAGRSTWRSDQ